MNVVQQPGENGKSLILVMYLLVSLLLSSLLYVNTIVPYLIKSGYDLGIYYPLLGLGNIALHIVAKCYVMKKY